MLTERRRKLRKNSTYPERLFWSKICNRQFYGLKFRRQHSIGYYVADFYCAELKLIIEIDGDSHFTKNGIQYDLIRSAYITGRGYQIIRYNNFDVMSNIDGVFQDLESRIYPHPACP